MLMIVLYKIDLRQDGMICLLGTLGTLGRHFGGDPRIVIDPSRTDITAITAI